MIVDLAVDLGCRGCRSSGEVRYIVVVAWSSHRACEFCVPLGCRPCRRFVGTEVVMCALLAYPHLPPGPRACGLGGSVAGCASTSVRYRARRAAPTPVRGLLHPSDCGVNAHKTPTPRPTPPPPPTPHLIAYHNPARCSIGQRLQRAPEITLCAVGETDLTSEIE